MNCFMINHNDGCMVAKVRPWPNLLIGLQCELRRDIIFCHIFYLPGKEKHKLLLPHKTDYTYYNLRPCRHSQKQTYTYIYIN